MLCKDSKKNLEFEIGMADGEERIVGVGAGIHESYTRDKRILPERWRDGKHGSPANRIGILPAVPAGDGRGKQTPC